MSTRRIRHAARIYLLDDAGHIMLFRFDVPDRPPFWCPPGGEVEPGETHAQAAARELLEETGIVADVGNAIDRVVSEFSTLEGEPVTGDDRYFLVRLAQRPTISTAGHTAQERRAMLTHRWFARDELAAWPETIYPLDVAARLDRLGF